MKRIPFINTLFILLAAFISCSKDKQTLTDNTWVLESMKVHTDSALMYRPDSTDEYIVMHWAKTPIVLSFPKKNEYSFKAETTTSTGKVSIVGNKINFKDAMSLALCCNSPFADLCMELLLLNINHYVINDDKLIFKGDEGEEINFVKQ